MRSGHVGRRAFLTLFALGLCAFILLLGLLQVGGGPPATSSLAAPSTPSALMPTSTVVPPALPVASPTETASERHPKLADPLAKLSDALTQPRAPGEVTNPSAAARLPDDVTNLVENGLMQIDSQDRVQVYIEVSRVDSAVVDALVAAGVGIQRVATDSLTVQGLVPATSLDAVAALDAVKRVRLPSYGFVQSSPATTQGDAIARADLVRKVMGVTGAGVRVGVISDGVYGLAAAQAAGELPPSVNYLTCNAILHGNPPGSLGFGDPRAAGAEGTAMLEIVHDIAPDAELWFGYFGDGKKEGGTDLDFNEVVDCLAANTDVVVDDIAFYDSGPYNGESVVSANTSNELNNQANEIRTYSTSVGNSALEHYRGQYVNAGPVHQSWHEFQATSDTTDAADLGSSPFDRVWLDQNGAVKIYLQWDDEWGASANDYNLYLFQEGPDGRHGSTPVASSVARQDGDDDPIEKLGYKNTGEAGYFDIAIVKRSGESRMLDMFVLPIQAIQANGSYHNFNTAASSIANEADAGGGVISVGAINGADPGIDTIEPFSARGPTGDGRDKPDVSGFDGVRVSGSGGFPQTFVGTSAAAATVAGVAALLLQCRPDLKAGELGDNPSADRTTLRDLILNNAVDLGTPGTDNTFGAGRLDAYASALAAGGNCQAPDEDQDGEADVVDNCPFDYNPDQVNTDAMLIDNGPHVAGDDASVPNADSLGDACDSDDDNDWMPDTGTGLSPSIPGEDVGCGSGPTNPLVADSDGDTVVDGYECLVGIDPNNASSKRPRQSADSDRDGLPDSVEALFSADPHLTDTDGDGVLDGVEVEGWGTSPALPDTDGDGCNDNIEIADVNGNYQVDIFDVLFVAKASAGLIDANVDFDLNKDGAINVLDVLMVAHQLYKVCTPP